MKYKKNLLFISFVFTSIFAFGQEKTLDRDFANSLFFNLDYPAQLFNSCVPTVCLLKLETDIAGHIVDMTLSDSADTLLKKAFNTYKHRLNISSLEKQIRLNFGNGSVTTTYIIPLSINIHKTNCPIEKSPNFKGYFTFEGEAFMDRAVRFLPQYTTTIKIVH